MLDELHKILTAFREHVAGLVNSGMVKTIDDHLDQLAAAAQGGIQSADDAVKTVLDELYTALHGSAPADVPVTAAPVADVPAGETVIVGEPGPEPTFPAAADNAVAPTEG